MYQKRGDGGGQGSAHYNTVVVECGLEISSDSGICISSAQGLSGKYSFFFVFLGWVSVSISLHITGYPVNIVYVGEL